MRSIAFVTTLLTVAFSQVDTTEADRRIETVTLAGAPEQIGALWGKINREAIREDMQEYFPAPAKKKRMRSNACHRR